MENGKDVSEIKWIEELINDILKGEDISSVNMVKLMEKYPPLISILDNDIELIKILNIIKSNLKNEYWSEIEKRIGKLVETSSSGSTIGEPLKSIMKKIYTKNEVKEERYFISYAAYLESKNDYDIFNNIITIDEPITMDIIQKIEDDYLNMVNEDLDERLYYSVQIISINKI